MVNSRQSSARAGRILRLGAVALGLAGSPVAAHECSGYDEEWGLCPDLKPCHTCSPVDCTFTEWGSWYEGGGCTGLVFRQRMVKVANNECGLPCSGAKIESMARLSEECVLEKQDCGLSEWSEWSKCDSPTDQSYRTRELIQEPRNGGESCSGETQETRPCGGGPTPTPCEFSDWQSWTDCSATCGEGRHTRMRKVLTEAAHNGDACKGTTLETQACIAAEPCPSQDCAVGDWSDWSMCDSGFHPQRYRAREVLQPAIGTGRQCANALKETDGCPAPEPVDCALSEWSSWAVCDKSCGGGQTYRSRFLKEPMSNAGKCATSSLREAAPCATALCAKPPGDCEVGVWGSWSECSAKCGKGSKTRKRKVLRTAETGGQGCTETLEEIRPCESVSCDVTDCQWSNWYDWSACSTSCGGGIKRRTRVVAAAPRNGGALCEPLTKSEAVPCNVDSCSPACVDGKWGEWLEWSKCSATCSSGFRSRRRDVAQDPNECGKPLTGIREEYEACSELPPCTADVDCALSDWQEWSYCSGTCYGIRERNRVIAVFAQGNGKACEAASLKYVEPCNPGPGELMPALCTKPAQDATLSPWSEWSSCSRSCGGGQKTKTRRLLTEPKNGGTTVSESLSLMAPCNTHHCGPVEPCIDCLWGEWGEWGECTKCGGQRWRHRSISRMPNYCGAPCDLMSSKEVSNCTSQCEETLFCAWTKWSEPSGCNAGCGPSTTMRNRALGLTRSAKSYLFSASGSTRCSGTQLSVEKCQDSKPCKEACEPRHAEFGPWSEWTTPSCVGLCERERSIVVMNNECGAPADGPLLETKRCEASCNPSLPCILSTWAEWSKCEDPSGQRFRSRAIEQMPTQDGAPCEGSLNETKACSEPCATQNCRLADWSDWGACARSCGGGWQTRNRRVVEHAKCGGALCDERLEEMQMCNEADCETQQVDCVLGSWNSWSGCGPNGQRYRERSVETLADGGLPCAGRLQETETCGLEAVDCMASEWTEWDHCEKTCGGGQQHRHREIHRYAANGGEACPTEIMQTRGCNAMPCSIEDCELGDWTAWDRCSTTCGVGQKRRYRKVLRNRNPDGLGCQAALSEAAACLDNPQCEKTDCAWGGWSEWGSCSSSCGGGQRSRDRQIAVAPKDGGKACDVQDKEEMEACNTEPCRDVKCVDGKWSDWTGWSPCSQTCGGGVTFRTRKVAQMATECGTPAAGKDREVEFCNADISCEPTIDCAFSDWGAWSDCSGSCSGVKRRSRRIATYGRGDGKFCVGGLKETSPCHPSPGGESPEGCVQMPPVDCLLGSWTEWSECSASCGGGRTLRTREVVRDPAHGGKACDGPLIEVSECGRDSCLRDSKDCQYGDWQDWSACAKCDGERKRFRHIAQYPTEGGQNCEAAAHEEIGSCPRRCGAETFCTWSHWQDWGLCTAECGEGRRNRRRYLALSDKPAEAPEPLAGNIVAEFEALQRRKQRLQTNPARGPALAFASGCLSFLLAFLGIRACAGSGSRRRRTLPAAAESPFQVASDYGPLQVME
mmetsp:Transcript_100453/g.279728  ORF Transcript_100453/g.279728 Transcript_100453/m.279728 type:complete len:1521 (-) Transcript_100453:417-4979(-)